MRKIVKAGVGVAGALTLSLAAMGPAFADYGPQPGDAVGVGSDTLQNIGNFLADGDVGGDQGYNAAGNVNRLISFDATPDENDRAGYLNGSTSGTLKALNPTIILRGGTSPVLRPNGSGSGIDALNADTSYAAKTGNATEINFVRASSLPSSGQETTATNNGSGGLRVVQISTDALIVATAGTTNAPASLSPLQLGHIYQCDAGYTTWNGTGIGGASTGTIIPLVPQAGSGTRKTFLNDLGAALGLPVTNGTQTQPTLGTCVQTVEENDPSSITGAVTAGATPTADPADAIAPFSDSRINLYNSGYFRDPTIAFPGAVNSDGSNAYLSPGIKPLTGSSLTTSNKSGASGTYSDVRGLYIIMRANDATNTAAGTGFQPGSTKTLYQTLFITSKSGTTTVQPYVNTAPGRALISAAGSTPSYMDLGVNP